MISVKLNYFTLCAFSIFFIQPLFNTPPLATWVPAIRNNFLYWSNTPQKGAGFISQLNIHSQTIISDESSPPDQLSNRAGSLSNINCNLSIQQWLSKGDFKMHGGPAGASNTWELTHPLDGSILETQFSFRSPKESPYLINIGLGGGNIKKGTVRDTDWDDGAVTHLSYSTSQGDTLMASLSFDYRLTDIKEPSELDVTFAYNYLSISANYRDAHTIIYEKNPVDDYLLIKWQIYDLVYEGIELGIKGKSEILKGLFLEATLGYTPFVTAEYKGRRYPDNIPVPTQKEHIIAKGGALNYQINLDYHLSEQFLIQGGYRYSAYRTKGEDQSDGYWKWVGSRENLDSDFKGCFFGAGIKF